MLDKEPHWGREHGKREIEKWLTNFFPKLKRTSTRTPKCRLIASVERMELEDDWQFIYWKYVRFADDEAEIFDKHKNLRENVKRTEFQRKILRENPELENVMLSRSDIREEEGEWEIPNELESKIISRGGEALVFSENFGDFQTAVRLQIFDPLLFTKDFGLDLITWEIHHEKDFITASDKEDSRTDDQIPRHRNVIKNFVNVELFHKDDVMQEDCLGWVTIMEKGGTNLRTVLKEETIGIQKRKMVAEGIRDGLNYLEKVGIKHCDLKLENFLVCHSGLAKIIDFGLVEETSERCGYRKMGYARKGSKFKNQEALAAATPGFAVQKQFSVGVGYNVQNHWFFLLCDWQTSWTLLYLPFDEDEIKKVDEIVKKCKASSIHQIKEANFAVISEITDIISIPSSSSIVCLDDPNLINSCHVSELKHNATKRVELDLENISRNVIERSTELSVAISVSTLVRFAMKNDLDWDEDEHEFYSAEKIIATLTLIIHPRSMAGLNLNPNNNEKGFQRNEIEKVLKILCKRTYLMDSGWEIIRQLGPAEIYQPVKSACKFERVLLNENFNFTRPLTVTCAQLRKYLGEPFFIQMVLDRIENEEDTKNAEYVIYDTCFSDKRVVRIPKTRGYYAAVDMMRHCQTGENKFIFNGPNGEFMRLVNNDFGNMKPETLYLLPQAYTMTLIPDQDDSATVQQQIQDPAISCLFPTGEKAMKKLNSEVEMNEWLTEFLAKLNRTSTRTQKCRLILSVERMLFDDHTYAAKWQYVRFGKYEAEILDKERKPLGEKINITEFQRMILESDEMKLSDADFLCRSKIKAETGEWAIHDDLQKERISEGGEALVFSQKFEDFETAVRVHIFDPFLFTAEFDSSLVTWKAHFETEFATACNKDKEDENKQNQMPKHENVIKNFVNFELFHEKDVNKEDCLGWVTVMEKADRTLRTVLKNETNIGERINMAEGIWRGFSYLEKIGVKHFDFKLDNVLLLNGVPKLIDFGLMCDSTGRAGYRKMGYCRRGSKFRNNFALSAATPGFAQQQQFAEGDGYNVDNFWYFLICDWKTSWSLLYKPIEEDERKNIDKILKSCRATFLEKGIKERRVLNFFEIKKTISIPKFTKSFYCLDDGIGNLTKSCDVSKFKEMVTKDLGQDLNNLTKNVIDQKNSNLCVPLSVSILLRHAIKEDLQFEDKNGYYTTEKILANLTLIVYPRSLAGFNLNPNKDETEFQVNRIHLLLNRLCQKTYLMDSGWEIIRRIGPAGAGQPKKSTCVYNGAEEEILNENFTKFTRPLTVTGAYLLPDREIDGEFFDEEVFFHQMTLDHIDNLYDYDKAEYVIANTSFKEGGSVVKIPRTRPYYADKDFVLRNKTPQNEYKYEDQTNGYFMKLVNNDKMIGNMQPETWYLLPQAYSITLIPE